MLTNKPYLLPKEKKLLDKLQNFIHIDGLIQIIFSYIDNKIRTKQQYEKYSALINHEHEKALINLQSSFLYGGIKFFCSSSKRGLMPIEIGNEQLFFQELKDIPTITYLNNRPKEFLTQEVLQKEIPDTDSTIYSDSYRLFSFLDKREKHIYYITDMSYDFFAGIEFIGPLDVDLTFFIQMDGSQSFCINDIIVRRDLQRIKSYKGESYVYILSNFIDCSLCYKSYIVVRAFSQCITINKIFFKGLYVKKPKHSNQIYLNDRLYYMKIVNNQVKLTSVIESLIEGMD